MRNMSKKNVIVFTLVLLIAFATIISGCGHVNRRANSPNGRRQDIRVGKVVSLTSSTLTLAVEQGAADVGSNATYNLTTSTKVQMDGIGISTGGQVPDLSSMGLKQGYYVALLVQDSNITGIAFNSDGSRPQRKQ